LRNRSEPPVPWASVKRMLLVLAPLALLAGCGGSDEQSDQPASEPRPAAKAEQFPAAKGQTIQELRDSVPEGPVIAPAVSSVEKGENRFAFQLYDVSRKALPGAAVALYTADENGQNLKGPYLARSESLDVKPQFRSRTTAADPASAKSVYVAKVPFQRNGPQQMTALARLDGRLVSASLLSIDVGAASDGPPKVGEKAIKVHTPTTTDVAGDLSKIDTRIPPAEGLHEKDLADALGKEPVVLAFATPALCQSRTCGPTIDIVDQVRAKYGDNAAFIHMEVYNDNRKEKGFRSQLGAWKLPTEPWVFVIDRAGKISDRFEGVVSAGELDRAVAKAVRN
jgi:hypothetical protein